MEQNSLNLRFKNYTHLRTDSKFTVVYNDKTSKEMNFTFNGGSLGFWVGKKFICQSRFKNITEPIPQEKVILDDPYFLTHLEL